MDIVKLIYVIVIYVKIILLIFSLSFTFISSEIKLWEKIIDPELDSEGIENHSTYRCQALSSWKGREGK